MSKQLLIFIAMLALAMTLFAENESVSCESEYGTCSLERSDTKLEKRCFCHNGNEHYVSDPVIEGFNDGPLTEEWCQTTIDNLCKKIDAQCSNEAGSCNVTRAGYYTCYCSYVDGKKTGDGYFGEEGCNEILVETCGTETPTPRKVCPEGILDECVSYFKRIKNNCSQEPVNIDEIIDTPIAFDYTTESAITVHEFADCCRSEYWRNEYKRESDCIETFESCEDKECCECTIQVGGNTEAGDAANTEAPTNGAAKEDTADEDKKEESKSDGCSLLFI